MAMDGEGMNRGLMFGLIGIGVAIVVGAIFIFLTIAGPKIFSEKRASAEDAELQSTVDDLQAQLDAVKLELADAKQSIAAKDKEISRLGDQVNTLKAKPKEEPKPAPLENPTNLTPYNATRALNLDDISTLTKANCNEAIAMARTNESAAHNYTENLSVQLELKRELRDNLTAKRDNATANNQSSEAQSYQNQIDDVEEEIEDLKDDIDRAEEREDAATDRRKRVVYNCNKILTA